MNRAEEPRLVALAGVALEHAIHNRTERAVKAVRMIGDEYGGDGAVQAALVWIDTLIADSGRTREVGDGKPVALSFYDVQTGEVGSASDVDPRTAWCGQLLAARFGDDESMFAALIKSVCPDDETFSKHIAFLLWYIAANYKLVLATREAAGGN
jgi:hypothetical protein